MFSPKVGFRDAIAVFWAVWRKQLSGRHPVVRKFEDEFARYNAVRYASAVNSGSSALFLALKALHLEPGTDVICPAFGYVAIPNAIVQAGLKPRFVDVQMNGNINPNLIQSEDAGAILAIDTYGHPCDYDELKEFGLPIIQDAAEALGAEYRGKKIHGDMACFSFFANKTITTGEGGMVVTDNPLYYKRVHEMKDQCGTDVRYFHTDYGYSLCMSALQATLGRSQLKRIDSILKAKAKRVEELERELGGWYTVKEGVTHGNWAYGFTDQDYEDSRPFFYPYNRLPMYADGKKYPISEYLWKHGKYLLT